MPNRTRSLTLRKDAQTPNGTIWSCFATPEDIESLADGELADTDHMLSVGDIINVRPLKPPRTAMTLRVVDRKADRVSMRRLRG